MAVITGIATGDMRCVLANGRYAIVARATGTDDLGVIDADHGLPQVGAVTIFTDGGRLNVRQAFTGGFDAVVTISTVTADVDVIKIRRQPGGGAVAVITGIATGDMRCVLANGRYAIVARATGTDDLGVIDADHGLPQVGAVTILTDGGRLNVRRALAGRLDAIMATGTITGDVDVIKIGRQPGDGAVTIITGITTCDMRCVFANGRYAIVARATGTDDLRMIDADYRLPQIGAVTILTDGCRLNVRRALAGRSGAVVTVNTVAADVDVIEVCRQPGDRAVAVITGIASGDMSCVLANGRYAIVARATGTDDLGVIDADHGLPQVGAVTILTDGGRLNVRQAFTGGNRTIVAGAADADNLGVIDVVSRCPDDPVMAVLANIGGLYMRQVLAGRYRAVVTINAITADIDMIKVRRQPGLGNVAIITRIGTGDMRWMFAGRNGAIVAGATGTDDLRVIDNGRWKPQCVAMAVFANVGGLNVGRALASGSGGIVTANAVVRDTDVIEASR